MLSVVRSRSCGQKPLLIWTLLAPSTYKTSPSKIFAVQNPSPLPLSAAGRVRRRRTNSAAGRSHSRRATSPGLRPTSAPTARAREAQIWPPPARLLLLPRGTPPASASRRPPPSSASLLRAALRRRRHRPHPPATASPRHPAPPRRPPTSRPPPAPLLPLQRLRPPRPFLLRRARGRARPDPIESTRRLTSPLSRFFSKS